MGDVTITVCSFSMADITLLISHLVPKLNLVPLKSVRMNEVQQDGLRRSGRSANWRSGYRHCSGDELKTTVSEFRVLW
ncbi:hypothetical protein O3M35_012311 [Rhynocoris fuscipes]|uniref:Uncharacterized protein n=1 Tax=Rhynocoris fuscipes TaxID=488301 RepID=A0AAW1CTC8_9HEMI